MTEEQYRRVERFHTVLVPWASRAIELDGRVVVEVGSGTGSSTLAFANYVDRIHCFEISESATKTAQVRLNHFGIKNVVFEDELFNANCKFIREGHKADVILLVAVLEHVYFKEFKEIITTAYECLNPGGIILIAETPNRLTYTDYHTSWLLFQQWLPQEVAIEYAKFSPRPLFKEQVGTLVEKEGAGLPEKHRETLTRWGNGVSYHDFEIALGVDVHQKIVLNGWEPEIFELAPVFDDDRFLVGLFDHLAIQTNRAFTRSWQYLAIRK